MLCVGTRRTAAGIAAAFGMAIATAAPTLPTHAADGSVATLLGSWSGNGRITYTDGSSEGISCNAYYTGSASDLRMAIQCKSDKNPIHIRSQLRVDGSRITGTWEERTFNASGTATGSTSAGAMKLDVTGGGFNGTMTVAISKATHTVSITTTGIAMSTATMNFSKR